MLEEPSTIDMAIQRPDGKLLLVITDSGMTTDPNRRFQLLIAKIQTYVGYILSDDFESEHPGKSPADVVIRMMCANPPTPEMQGLTKVSPSGNKALSIPVEYELFKPSR